MPLQLAGYPAARLQVALLPRLFSNPSILTGSLFIDVVCYAEHQCPVGRTCFALSIEGRCFS